jgi:hypothetical protein
MANGSLAAGAAGLGGGRGDQRRPLHRLLHPRGRVGRRLQSGPRSGRNWNDLQHALFRSAPTLTDAAGRFRTEGLPAEQSTEARVAVGKGPVFPKRIETVTLRPGETRDLGDLLVTVDE